MDRETSIPIYSRGLGEIIAQSIRVERQGEQYFDEIREHLTQGSVIVPFNHRSIIDPLVVMREMRGIFGGNIQRFILPASMKFYDGRMGTKSKNVMDYYGKKYGIEILPIIQHYDEAYTEDEKFSNYKSIIKTILGALGEPGTVVALSPEGTRSPTGKIIEAQKGIDLFMRKVPNSLVFPLALEGTDDIMSHESRSMNPFKKARVTYGCPLLSSQVIETSTHLRVNPRDLVMLQIAKELSDHDKGYYSEQNFPWFYDMYE